MNNEKLVRIGNELVPVAKIKHLTLDTQKDHPFTSKESEERLNVLLKIKEAWETLDDTIFSKALSDNTFQYGSYWVSETMYGKRKYLDYIKGKFDSIRRTQSGPIIAIVLLKESIAPQEYTIALHLTQGTVETLLTFTFDGTEVTSMYMTDPDIFTYAPLYRSNRTPQDGDICGFLDPNGEPLLFKHHPLPEEEGKPLSRKQLFAFAIEQYAKVLLEQGHQVISINRHPVNVYPNIVIALESGRRRYILVELILAPETKGNIKLNALTDFLELCKYRNAKPEVHTLGAYCLENPNPMAGDTFAFRIFAHQK